MNHGLEPEGQLDEPLDKLIRNGAAEAIAPAFRVEPEKMFAVFAGFTDPELPN